MTRKPSLELDLPPTIGVDTGSAATAIDLRVGTRLIATSVVRNGEQAERGNDAWALGLSPESAYAVAVWREIVALAAAHRSQAEAWWAEQGHTGLEKPWLLAVEKVNFPRPGRPGQPVNACVIGSVHAALGVAWYIAGRAQGRVVWTRPDHADTRWEPRFDGTGDPRDYYPAELLAGYGPLSDGSLLALDHPSFRAADGSRSRVKDLCAAWSVASDSAEDFVKASLAKHGCLLPPEKANLWTGMLNDLRRSLVTRPGLTVLPPTVETCDYTIGDAV